jgi:bacterioferritin (cytochrome b1)
MFLWLAYFLYSRITKNWRFFIRAEKKFKSAIFESVSNAQKLSPSLQIWTIGSFISQLHVY